MPDETWQALEQALALAPRTHFKERLRQELEGFMDATMTKAVTPGVPEGLTTVTPYVTVVEAEKLIAFTKAVFGAEEWHRVGGGDWVHAMMGIGDSAVMIAGGTAVQGREIVGALHVYVPDVDATDQRALDAGAQSIQAPEDKPYGERNSAVKDSTGNLWFIATSLPGRRPIEDQGTVTAYLLAKNAPGLIDFLKNALGATELTLVKGPDGALMHAVIRVGDALLELGEWFPQPAQFHLYVPDADALYAQAVAAGATSLYPPAIKPYGDRCGGVRDPWGNTWHIATEIQSEGTRQE